MWDYETDVLVVGYGGGGCGGGAGRCVRSRAVFVSYFKVGMNDRSEISEV